MFTNGLRYKRGKYPEAVRNFCFRQQFHSSSGYRELRKFFNNNLPTIRTLQKWLTCVDASPGITQVALDKIAEEASEYKLKGQQLNICLINDEISLREQVFFDDKNMLFEGFCESTDSKTRKKNNKTNEKKVPLVKNALVFMAVAPNFRITVAYTFLRGMNAVDRAAITKEVIRRIDLTGARVISLTGDGLHANMTVATLLGADFKNNRPYIPRPCNIREKIYIVFDPPHMVKLLRKYLSEQKLQYKQFDMDWELLCKLANIQDSDNFPLTSKLTMSHILWKNHKMNVKKAVQIFSNENADALEQLLEDNYQGFERSKEFIEFLRLVNNVYDVMNFGEGKKSDHIFKQPLMASNIEKIRKLFQSFENFISQMSIETKRGKNIKRKAAMTQIGFIGLVMNMHSTIGIYEDYVENSQPDVFFQFQFSQDHLETYFSLTRNGLGNNTNPNTRQFQSAYRKLLFCSPHISGEMRTNCCVEFPHQLLNVSSGIISSPKRETRFSKLSQVKALEIEMNYASLTTIDTNLYNQHVYALVASDIEAKITKRIQMQKTLSCQDCLDVFKVNKKIDDAFIAKKIGKGHHVAQPCFSTYKITLACEEIIEKTKSLGEVNSIAVAKTIFNNIYFIEELYDSTEFESHQRCRVETIGQFSHKDEFILEIVFMFLTIKSNQICERIFAEERAEERAKKMKKKNKMSAGK